MHDPMLVTHLQHNKRTINTFLEACPKVKPFEDGKWKQSFLKEVEKLETANRTVDLNEMTKAMP